MKLSELHAKLGKLQENRRVMEKDKKWGKIILDWKEYLLLSDGERKQRLDAWDKYYNDVKQGIVYEMVQAQKKALESKQMALALSIQSQLRELKKNNQIDWIKKPSYPDPNEFIYGTVIAEYGKNESAIKDTVRLIGLFESGTTDDIFDKA